MGVAMAGACSEVFLGVVKLTDVNRAEIARVVGMQKLLSARIATKDWSHRRHHVIVTIDFVDEGDSGLRVFMGGRNDPVPDIAGMNHSGPGWILLREAISVGSFERCSVCESYRAFRAALEVDGIIGAGDRIKDRLLPRLAIERQLEPFIIVYGL